MANNASFVTYGDVYLVFKPGWITLILCIFASAPWNNTCQPFKASMTANLLTLLLFNAEEGLEPMHVVAHGQTSAQAN